MIRNRFNHWSCSKFADFILGEKKPNALEWGQWDKYYDDLKKRKPWRYWITEHLLKKIQDIVYYPYDIYKEIRYYIRNRWIDKTHYLKTGLKPGRYYELDNRILHGLFNELVEFVEMDLAQLSKHTRDKKYKFKNDRCIEAAYDYFDWASNLRYDENCGTSQEDSNYGELTPQAKSTIKIKDLYEWWTKIRPLRDDPRLTINKETHGEKYFEAITFVENAHENEDNKMLISLIKIRRELWT